MVCVTVIDATFDKSRGFLGTGVSSDQCYSCWNSIFLRGIALVLCASGCLQESKSHTLFSADPKVAKVHRWGVAVEALLDNKMRQFVEFTLLIRYSVLLGLRIEVTAKSTVKLATEAISVP